MKDSLKLLFDDMLKCDTELEVREVVNIIMNTLVTLEESSDIFKILKSKLTVDEYNQLLNCISMTLTTSVYVSTLKDKDIDNLIVDLSDDFSVKKVKTRRKTDA